MASESRRMTDHGDKLPELTTEEVTERLCQEIDGKAVKRLVAAREYLDGQSPAEISRKYGWPEQTIYSWFDRLESQDLDDALHDDSPPGRPATLSEAEFDQFRTAVNNPPDVVGFDEQDWSPSLARQFIRDEFGYTFSRRHVRRLLKDPDLAT